MNALSLRDLSRYTVLAYARGLAHFHGWCVEQSVCLAEVTPTTVQAYVEAFRWRGERERAAATTNHRLSLLASYFDHLIAKGGDAPKWREKTNPVRPAQRLERAVPMRRRAERLRADLRRRLPRRVTVHLTAEESLPSTAPPPAGATARSCVCSNGEASRSVTGMPFMAGMGCSDFV